MIQRLQNLQKKIDARSERERMILFAIVFALFVMISLNMIVQPKMRQVQDAKLKHQQNLAALQLSQVELEQINAGRVADVDADIKRQISESQNRLEDLRVRALAFEKNLVAPEKMNEVLEQVLSKNKSLRLISLKSYPVENILRASAMANDGPASAASVAATASSASTAGLTEVGHGNEVGLFKHEVELVFEGNYLDMLAYLKALEAMQERLYWNKVSLRVVEYPQSRLKLRVFTVSQEKKWLDL